MTASPGQCKLGITEDQKALIFFEFYDINSLSHGKRTTCFGWAGSVIRGVRVPKRL